MNTIADLIDDLDAASERLPARAAELLVQPIDWSGLVLEALRAASPDEFHQLATAWNVKDVQPWNILLHTGVNYKIVLNHFDKSVFAECARRRTISPHRHHFDFTTRVIAGRYFQWIYENRGAVDEPELRMLGQVCTDLNDVYEFGARDYHFVSAVDDDTVSLQIRYAEEDGVQWRGDPALTRDDTSELHRRLLGTLQPALTVPGRIVELFSQSSAQGSLADRRV